MKLILSRKGFDSGENSGGCASPIFCDGSMFSLPIPDNSDFWITYDDLRHPQADIGELVQDLTHTYAKKFVKSTHGAHLDPHINLATYAPNVAPEEWRGLLGQARAAQSHLHNQGVGEGDLFLFFGLYRPVAWTDDGWRYTNCPERHVLWGWLQIGETLKVAHAMETGDHPSWVKYHPHWQDYGKENPRNTIYMAQRELDLGNAVEAPGFGVFPQFDERLLLTNPDEARVTRWRLPPWFHPSADKKMLSWHGNNRGRWTPEPDAKYAYLNSQSRGQEFVLDCDHYPEAIGWARDLIRDLGAK